MKIQLLAALTCSVLTTGCVITAVPGYPYEDAVVVAPSAPIEIYEPSVIIVEHGIRHDRYYYQRHPDVYRRDLRRYPDRFRHVPPPHHPPHGHPLPPPPFYGHSAPPQARYGRPLPQPPLYGQAVSPQPHSGRPAPTPHRFTHSAPPQARPDQPALQPPQTRPDNAHHARPGDQRDGTPSSPRKHDDKKKKHHDDNDR